MGDLSSATNPAGKKPICREEEEEERERERLMHRLLVEVLQHIYLKISKAQTSHPAIIKFVSNQQNISLPVCGGS